MALLNFRRPAPPLEPSVNPQIEAFLQDYSIEVMPRTAEKVENFRELLPEGTRVYIAHIEGTPIDEMIATAKRLNRDGYQVMPHFPARIIKDRATLKDWIARYQGEANVSQALLLAGGVEKPHGDFDSSMQLMETGLFDEAGFRRLHVAGHPEGNRDIDADGSMKNVSAALRWKNDFQSRTDAQLAIATQFAFDAQPIIKWADSIAAEGITLPVHIGVAGPAKLQTLDQIRHRMRCRPVAESAAKTRDGCHQTVAALRADRGCRATGGPQGSAPRFQRHACSLLSPRRHQDKRQLGHRKRRILRKTGKRLIQGLTPDDQDNRRKQNKDRDHRL